MVKTIVISRVDSNIVYTRVKKKKEDYEDQALVANGTLPNDMMPNDQEVYVCA